MQRFEVEPDGDNGTLLSCTRCEAWTVWLTEPLSLAELVQRADEHTEVCR